MIKRELSEVQLRAVPSSRFQPTGFPDLGPATYEAPDGGGGWVDSLLVESNQSVANHLEATAWNQADNEPVSLLAGLPWVRVTAKDNGRYLTSSRTEAHRLASAFVKASTDPDGTGMIERINNNLALAVDTPLDHGHIAKAIFKLDPFCLIHGVFFADKNWQGQPKIPRALSGMIEATDVKAAQSGGVKHDDVRHQNVDGGGSAEGYGTVPFHRTEYTAQKISARFSLDLPQIHGYGLSENATNLLIDLAKWEIRSFLETGLRLRTACEFEVIEGQMDGLPSLEELESQITTSISGCPELQDLSSPVLDVVWHDTKKKKK